MIAPVPYIKRNLEYLNPLFKLSNLFGIYQQPGLKPKFLKIYSFVIMALLVLSPTVTMPKKLRTHATTGATKYLDIIISLWRTAINIIILFSVKDENILVTQLKNTLEIVGNILTQFYEMNYLKRQRVFLVEMVCIITLLTGSLTCKFYINFYDPKIDYTRTRIFSFFIECIEKYIVTITIMIFYNLVLSVKDKFNFINAKLAILSYKTAGDFIRILQAFSKMHYLLCEAVEYINDNFGYMLFGLILMISLDLIMGVNVVITFILHGDSQHTNVPVEYALLPHVSTSLLFLVSQILLKIAQNTYFLLLF